MFNPGNKLACWLISLIAVFGSCSMQKGKKKFPDTPEYTLSDPKIIRLPAELDEISGIVYYPRDTSVFAIIDEDGLLYKIPLKNPKFIRKWTFDKARDFEDLVLIDSTFYVLVSKGDIITLKFQGDSISAEKSDFSDVGKSTMEFESLLKLNDSTLLMICKECVQDDKETVSSYTYHLSDSGNVYKDYIRFNVNQLNARQNLKGKLKMSAATIHPITGDIYMISSIQNVLYITDSDGNYKASYELNPIIYKQPEGITFTPEGNMIISNEFADEGFGELLLFKYKRK